MSNDLIKAELAMYGLLIEGNNCDSIVNGHKVSTSVGEQELKLQQSISDNKQLFNELWEEIIEMLETPPVAIAPGGEATRRMFSETIRHLYSLAIMLKQKRSKYILKIQLKKDVASYPESFMSQIIDYKIGLDWVHHLVRSDKYRLNLLRKIDKGDDRRRHVHAISGPWSNLDLPMQERVWSYEDERENIEDGEMQKQKQQRYQIPDTYNDPYDIEEGFYYREEKNEPYSWEDRQEESPYPHRNLLDDN
jgi:hypothetical protein